MLAIQTFVSKNYFAKINLILLNVLSMRYSSPTTQWPVNLQEDILKVSY